MPFTSIFIIRNHYSLESQLLNFTRNIPQFFDLGEHPPKISYFSKWGSHPQRRWVLGKHDQLLLGTKENNHVLPRRRQDFLFQWKTQ